MNHPKKVNFVMKMKKKYYDIILGLACLLVGVAIFTGTYFFRFAPIGREFGPQIYPRMVSALLVLLGSISLLRPLRDLRNTSRGNHTTNKDSKSGQTNKTPKESFLKGFLLRNRVLCSFVLFILYYVAINVVGYYVSTVVFLIVFMLFLGLKSYMWIFVATTGFLLFVYSFFSWWMHLPIPHGFLF